MPHRNIITENSEEETWKVIADQLTSKDDNLDYTAQFNTQNYCVTLDIDIHPDRIYDDEDVKPLTTFSISLPANTSFRFRIEKQSLKHEIGKLFGLQDVVIGNTAFDKRFLIQSNDEAKVKTIFSNAEVSAALLQYPVVDFEIREHKIGANKEIVFRLNLEGGITEPAVLKSIFQSYKTVLNTVQ